MKRKLPWLLLACMFMTCGCRVSTTPGIVVTPAPSPTATPGSAVTPTPTATPTPAATPAPAATPGTAVTPAAVPATTPGTVASTMTTEEKVAQLFIILPEKLTGTDTVTMAGETTKNALAEYPVGGLIYMENNIRTPDQLTQMLANTKKFSAETEKVPLFLGIDEEGGTVARIASNGNFGVPSFPSMKEIGAAKDPSAAYALGSTIGSYLKKYGFTIDFAPDADVLSNPDNKVIGSRSFGNDPDLVWQMASEQARGLAENGIIPVFKHFPGHGATSGNTHKGMAYTDKTLEELLADDLIPFERAAQKKVPAIMVAHISLPSVTGSDIPASLSGDIVTGILRKRFSYDGLVMTDAFDMKAITDVYSSDEAAVMAIEAGCDMIMMPADFHDAYNGVLAAVKSGRISETRLNESITRILKAKGLQ